MVCAIASENGSNRVFSLVFCFLGRPSVEARNMEIRKATVEDIPAIVEIRLSVRENSMSRDRMEELGITADSLETMLDSTHSGFCAEIEGRIVGFSMADLESSSIFALFIRPEFEGLGIGGMLLDAAVEEIQASGRGRVTLSTDHGTRAFEFYRKKGWKHIGNNPDGEAVLELVKSER